MISVVMRGHAPRRQRLRLGVRSSCALDALPSPAMGHRLVALALMVPCACATPRSNKVALGAGLAFLTSSIVLGATAESDGPGMAPQAKLALGAVVVGITLTVTGAIGLLGGPGPLADETTPPAPHPEAIQRRDLETLLLRALDAAAAGDCATVVTVTSELRRRDRQYYQVEVLSEPALAPCLTPGPG